MTFIVNIIGAGNLGKTIGFLLHNSALVEIGSICNTSKESALSAIGFIGAGKYCAKITELPPADLTLISTPDRLISEVCQTFSKNKQMKKGSLVVHCSGVMTTEALISAKKVGCYVASIHPMRSFAIPASSIEQYKGTYCAMEGDKAAIDIIEPLFKAIGSIPYVIDQQKKSLYHAAGVFSSNYLVTLSKQALICLEDAGVEHPIAMGIITNIMQGTVSNLAHTLSPEKSLTGPIERGDVLTIQEHLNSLHDEEQKHLYATLGKATIPLTALDEHKKKRMYNLLRCKK